MSTVVTAFTELRDISKSYGGQVVLDCAELSVERGEFVVICGRSGSGKSTLLKLIGALDTPDAGRVIHAGRDLAAMSDAERTRFRRESLGFVFQFFNLIPTLTVAENVELPLALNRLSRDVAAARIRGLLAELGVPGAGDRYPDELSGGEQQRVAIARALAHEPTLVVADEPTGNLDLETAEQVLELLGRSCRERHTTLIIATHSTEAIALADRVLEIRAGKIVPVGV
jgi:putative ABC transport system ATP-binding protein